MNYTDVFGNQTLPPSSFGYVKLTIVADTTVVWPYNADSTSTAVAKITEVDCQATNTLTLPDATQVSVGEDVLIRNVGSNVLIVKNSGGTQIASVAVGAASYFYLTDNTSVSGIFSVVDFGVGTSSVDAASLVGYGIKAVGASLNQSHPVLPVATSLTIDATHRSSLIVFTGGASTFNLTASATLGDDFFVLIRNDGTGTLTLDPASSETIDGLMSVQLQPSESMFLLCTGTQWYSVGYGRSTLYQFTQLTLDVSAGGTITLTAAEAANKLITFIGNPSGAVTVVVPAIVAVYYTYSAISTAHSITVKTASGSGATVDQGSRVIMLCDATNVLSAQSSTSNSSVSLTDGSVTVPSLFFGTQTNTGVYKYGTDGLGFAINGVDVCHITSTGLVVNGGATVSGTLGATNLTVSGTFALTGDQVQVSEGGTGATDASGARTNLGLGTAATQASTAFATAAQGALADTAVQPAAIANMLETADIGITVQAYDADTAKTDVAQTWAATQRTQETTDNDGSFDLNAALDFECTPTAGFTLTFTNIPASPNVQRGSIFLVNGANYAAAAHANTKVTSSLLTTISATGTYIVAYETRNGLAYVTSAGAFA